MVRTGIGLCARLRAGPDTAARRETIAVKLPQTSFYLFGMGSRAKYLYRDGTLISLPDRKPLRSWSIAGERVLPERYRVELETSAGRPVAIWEDEEGLWLEDGGSIVCLSAGRVALPSFENHSQATLLRVLHQEMLVNIVGGAPVPNLLVYKKPWYRDGAMVCMALEKTGNLHVVQEWIHGLIEPFDRNNRGNCEPDNLGQALYLISLVSDASHPLVPELLAAAKEITVDAHLTGLTDGGEQLVYQTKWMKFGLSRLGLDDHFEIPVAYDEYSPLFWMAYTDAHVPGPRFEERAGELYPYLTWAEAHFLADPPPLKLLGSHYPLTWEAEAGEADYAGMSLISQEYTDRKICAPHTWHAAEAFLHLLELG
jgi:hypothetical protein